MTALQLSVADKRKLLQIARETLTDYLGEGKLPHYETANPALLSLRAAFVTLRRRDTGELRGCRGESQARRPLIESVTHNTIASATDDPRFPPVTVDEVPLLHIEISALTPLKAITPKEIEVGRHGLMIVRGTSAGLLLPQVPTRHGWDRVSFLQSLCRKAWLPEGAWMDSDAQLFGFETEVWGEED